VEVEPERPQIGLNRRGKSRTRDLNPMRKRDRTSRTRLAKPESHHTWRGVPDSWATLRDPPYRRQSPFDNRGRWRVAVVQMDSQAARFAVYRSPLPVDPAL